MDTILRGGRVIDPGTGTDAILDVGISRGRVTALSESITQAGEATVIDVRGLIVGPGFVDLHSHVHSIAGQRLQALDGVTTALDLEAGVMPLQRAYDEAANAGRPLNYGFSASWAFARGQVLAGVEPDADMNTQLALLGDPRWQRSSTPRELARWLELLDGELAAGALGIGVLMGYAPRSDPAEFLALAHLAAKAGAPAFTHVREIAEADPTTPIDGSTELIRAAEETGAAMHHCHVNSTSRRHLDQVLARLDNARSLGAPLTVEAYPYGAGSTGIGASFLAPDRIAVMGLTPTDIVMVNSGERIADLGRLRELRASDPGALCIVHFLDEDDTADRELLQRGLIFPDSIVASDAMPLSWPDGSTDTRAWPLPPGATTHPRTAGTFAKSLRQLVRETGLWSWPEAFRRCSYLPARVLDDIAPDARRKGHLGIGADADIVVLDPDAVTDNATYADSARPSSGVRELLVAGVSVVRNGALDPDAYPGQPLRGQPG
ncbi:amidohydrolase family protein [Kribbella sp. NPDC023855]|uniref:amidohydrolase family protein n=1 Tax=Kribbella sp. NPDC023855 TaxID=3154698 RepID=UPI0033F34E92